MSLVAEHSDLFLPQLKALKANIRHIDNSTGSVDCSSLDWVTPLTILPLASYICDRDRTVTGLGTYLETIHFPDGIKDADSLLKQTYIPIVQFSVKDIQKLNSLTDAFWNLILRNINFGEHVRNALNWAISELVTNVCEHASSSNGWLFAQYWPAREFLDFVILDCGVGFKAPYEDFYGEQLTDKKAIRYALEGKSVKDDHERGFGLHTTKNLVTKSELKGKFLIISGGCGYYADRERQTWLNLGEWKWQGSIICARINKVERNVNISSYVE